MPKHGKQILAEALRLPPVERAELVEDLLSSFEFQSRNRQSMLYGQRKQKTESMRSSGVRCPQFPQKKCLQKSKRQTANENRIPSSRKGRAKGSHCVLQ